MKYYKNNVKYINVLNVYINLYIFVLYILQFVMIYERY